MLVVIRDGEKLSLKSSFVVQLFVSSLNLQLIRVSRKESKKFSEQWNSNKIDLATSTSGILAYFLLMPLKSPRNLRDGVLRRLSVKQNSYVLLTEGFLSVLSQVLHYYFATSSRTDGLMRFLRRMKPPKIFLIDEFSSINTMNLNELRALGLIIYVSQDVAYNRYGFRDNLITRELMYKLERRAIAQVDLVIACSERDRLKYIEMGAKNAVYYPNIYPIKEFAPSAKDQFPSITIVSRGYWDLKAERSLEEIFKALSYSSRIIKVNVIGIKPKKVPKNIRLKHYEFIPSKLDYLKILSESWIGINVGFHLAGTNERKYDYAMSRLVVFSDAMGARGDFLPHEYTYVDSQDLAAKLEQLFQFGKDKIAEMGDRNRDQVLSLAEKQRETLLKTINDMVIH